MHAHCTQVCLKAQAACTAWGCAPLRPKRHPSAGTHPHATPTYASPLGSSHTSPAPPCHAGRRPAPPPPPADDAPAQPGQARPGPATRKSCRITYAQVGALVPCSVASTLRVAFGAGGCSQNRALGAARWRWLAVRGGHWVGHALWFVLGGCHCTAAWRPGRHPTPAHTRTPRPHTPRPLAPPSPLLPPRATQAAAPLRPPPADDAPAQPGQARPGQATRKSCRITYAQVGALVPCSVASTLRVAWGAPPSPTPPPPFTPTLACQHTCPPALHPPGCRQPLDTRTPRPRLRPYAPRPARDLGTGGGKGHVLVLVAGGGDGGGEVAGWKD